MNSIAQKQLVYVAKVGPAFSLNEVTEAHAALDLAGAPRIDDNGKVYTLPERIYWLHEVAMITIAGGSNE